MLNYYRGLKGLKISIKFKHVRLKSSNMALIREINLSNETCKVRIQNLAEILNCNVLTAREIAAKNRNVFALSHHEFNQNVQFCKNYLKLSDLVEFPFILSLNSSLLQHRYFSLKELGCSNVNASNILRFPQILKKTPRILKQEGFLFSCGDNFDILNKYLESSDRREIYPKLQLMYNDGSNLWEIREAINAEFLSAKLGCSIGKAHQMLLSYPPLRVQSIVNTDKLLDILLGKFDFSVSKICSSLNLLSLHPESVENFISEIPEILGINTVCIAKKMPLMLRRPIDSIQKVEAILKEFSISEDQFMCCPKVVGFTPNTVKERLTTLCESKDFSLLKSYKKFLWLVYYFNNLSPRLEVLKAKDIPCSISMFLVSKSNFKKYLCVSECRTYINDICFYLSRIFSNISEKEILIRLREYPNYQNSSLINCQNVINYLSQSGVTNKQIFNGLGIIFYDVDVVKLYFDDLKNHPECQPFNEWASHYNLIQLLIYTIEVDSGFQGFRLYKTKSKVDEQEDLLLNYSTN